MDEKTIESLKEALKHSPDNIPLRLHLADTLLRFERLAEAEDEYQLVLQQDNNPKAILGIARVFYAQAAYSKCNVVLEQLVDSKHTNFEVLLLHTRALVKEEAIPAAVEVYKKALALKPDFVDEELDGILKVVNQAAADDEGLEEEANTLFTKNLEISFADVGGMEQVKKEIDLKIIQPFKQPELYKAYGKKIGGGILLYGPPGCGKTFLAKATAGEVNAKFINVSLNDILDMWIGNSEKNLHEIFENARRNAPCVLFFDEIDALGASRSDMRQSGGRHLINQFLQELDGAESSNDGVLILGATNAPWHLDAAFRRPGRFDRILFVPPPDEKARERIFELKMNEKPQEKLNFLALAQKTKEFSGADIAAVVDIAIEAKLEAALKAGTPQPIVQKDLIKAAKKHKATTKEWFASAKNYALYANESGLYDEILAYLKLKR